MKSREFGRWPAGRRKALRKAFIYLNLGKPDRLEEVDEGVDGLTCDSDRKPRIWTVLEVKEEGLEAAASSLKAGS
jgi:hypothetical protein